MTNKTKLTTSAVDRLNVPGICWAQAMAGLGIRIAYNAKTKRTLKAWFFKRRVKDGGIERNVSLAELRGFEASATLSD